MKWTAETPTHSGFYWLGQYGFPPEPVRVAALPGGYYGVAFLRRALETDLFSYRPEDGWRWAGPLHIEPVPKEQA